jgi:hypothetical protein
MLLGFVPNAKQLHATTLRKRLAFVRASGKMLVSSSTRYKTMLSKNPQVFSSAAHRILDQVEAINALSKFIDTVRFVLNYQLYFCIAETASKQAAESALLLGEVLAVTSASSSLAAVLVPACCQWLQGCNGRSAVVRGLLRCLGVSVSDPKVLGTLMEETIVAFFRDPGGKIFNGNKL